MTRAQQHMKGVIDSDSPEGWTIAKLGDLCTHPQYGWTTSANKNTPGLKLLRTTDISGGIVNWSMVPFCAEEPNDPEKYLLETGDILVSRAGSVGLSYLVKECPQAIFASYLIRFRPKPPIESEFIALLLKSPEYWASIADQTSGIAIPNVNASKLKELEVPLPPLAEQKRIVEKVEDLLERIKATKDRLAKVSMILKRFRQAVLAAACSGRLTADWREEHVEIEPVTLNSKVNELPETLEALQEIKPSSWTFASVKKIANTIQYGYTASAKQEPVGPKFLRITDIQNGQVNWNDVPYCAIPDDKIAKFLLIPGDILFTRTGATTGKSFLIRSCPRAVFASYLIRVQPVPLVDSKFLYLFFQSDLYWKQIAENIAGSAQPNCNASKLATLILPLPPILEQLEIARQVDVLFKLADGIEKRVAAATARAEKLTRAILTKAFRGELVPTEAELARLEGRPYETASELLARIKSERDAKQTSQKVRRNRN